MVIYFHMKLLCMYYMDVCALSCAFKYFSIYFDLCILVSVFLCISLCVYFHFYLILAFKVLFCNVL